MHPVDVWYFEHIKNLTMVLHSASAAEHSAAIHAFKAGVEKARLTRIQAKALVGKEDA
jgi:hypothetical protein